MARGDERVIALAAIPHSPDAHRFAGADHGLPVSIILVHTAPGGGPSLHRHPHAEVFVVQAGEATFRLGEETIVVPAGHIVIGPPNVPHAFTNTGQGELRIVSVHAAGRFETEAVDDD